MTDEEAMALSDCGRGCYIIGGPWISYDPDCPLHGYAAREREQGETMTRVFVGPDLVELETKKTITFPKPLSQWLSENRFEFERTATVSCLPRVEGMNVITPISPITYVDSQGLMTALARYEKYVDEHFNL